MKNSTWLVGAILGVAACSVNERPISVIDTEAEGGADANMSGGSGGDDNVSKGGHAPRGGSSASTENSHASGGASIAFGTELSGGMGGTTSSIGGTTTSNGGTTTSVGGTTTSNGGTTTSVGGTTTSVGGTTTSVGGTTTSNGGTTTSNGGTTTSNGGTTTSVGGTTTSVGGTTTSNGGTTTSNGGTTTSNGGTTTSVGGTTTSNGGTTTSNGGTTTSVGGSSGAAKCTINGVSYTAGTKRPSGACHVCEPTQSTTAWTTDARSCGCTGTFETVQDATGLCVANTVPIVGGYRIDQTEVTIGQYGQWVKTNPGLPGGSDTSCNWKTSYNEGGGFTGGDASHHPVGLVDWCDAYYYCAAIGKRLCGKIGGGSYDYNEESFKNNNISQWYRACSSGGTNTYPYGSDGSMLGLNCNVKVPGSRSESVVTGTLENCQTTTANYAGVFDLVGNVYEWEDSCKVNPADSANVQCRARGGSFDSNTILDTCDASGFGIRNQKKESLGFRCCSL